MSDRASGDSRWDGAVSGGSASGATGTDHGQVLPAIPATSEPTDTTVATWLGWTPTTWRNRSGGQGGTSGGRT